MSAVLDIDLAGFPIARTRVRGSYRALYAELLPNSGERLTVAVAGNFDGKLRILPAPGLEKLAKVYGNTSNIWKDAAAAVARSLPNAATETLEDCTLPLHCLQWSSWTRRITGDDWKDALNVALSQSSLLAAYTISSHRDRTEPKLPSMASLGPRIGTRREVRKQILTTIQKAAPAVARYMRENRPGSSVDMPDFVGERAVAEFAVLRQAQLEDDLTDLQGSLWRLDNFRGGQRRPIAFVCTDQDVTDGSYGDVLRRSIDQAAHRKMELRAYPAPEKVVDDLLTLEAA